MNNEDQEYQEHYERTSEYAPKIQAYLERINSGELSSTKEKTLRFIDTFTWATVHDMRVAMDIAHQTLTSALSHLEDEGIVYKSGEVIQGKQNRAYSVWKYESDPIQQGINAKRVLNRKFNIWKTSGLDRFQDLMHQGLINQLTNPTMF
jgi:DNA-binding transcriptional ArsR family regulator